MQVKAALRNIPNLQDRLQEAEAEYAVALRHSRARRAQQLIGSSSLEQEQQFQAQIVASLDMIIYHLDTPSRVTLSSGYANPHVNVLQTDLT